MRQEPNKLKRLKHHCFGKTAIQINRNWVETIWKSGFQVFDDKSDISKWPFSACNSPVDAPQFFRLRKFQDLWRPGHLLPGMNCMLPNAWLPAMWNLWPGAVDGCLMDTQLGWFFWMLDSFCFVLSEQDSRGMVVHLLHDFGCAVDWQSAKPGALTPKRRPKHGTTEFTMKSQSKSARSLNLVTYTWTILDNQLFWKPLISGQLQARQDEDEQSQDLRDASCHGRRWMATETLTMKENGREETASNEMILFC